MPTYRALLPAIPLRILQLRGSLTIQLARREIAARYRGSTLGIAWSLLTPLLMLAVYTFVFGSVFKARWPATGGEGRAGAGNLDRTISGISA